uniref:ATP synthase F0 subunit 6 n=1 Tax=Ossuaria sichuanensis TaxID=3060451 RepID=UPI00286B0B46|nr:ATP synthase F0 subunit 6 [Ossuaria sichuanensis]WKW96221.1 ATP synthase F0 subunit 6 [Ossuaria sichuanensis]
MMTNLFSVFDPCTGILSLNWLSMMMFLFIMPYKFWILPNKSSMSMMLILNNLHKEIIMLMPYKGMSLIMLSLFLFILFNNLMGLLPYIFTSSSQLIFSNSLAVPMWLSMIMYGVYNKLNHMFSHLVPSGTPFILMPFMVLIETVSNIIRPGSLAVRLAANMIAGHLLMSLLGNNTSNFMMFLVMFMYIGIMMFETAVALIQSYVFMTLTTLYSSEI